METGGTLLTGDFDADKRSDLVCRKNDGMEYKIALSGLHQHILSCLTVTMSTLELSKRCNMGII